jgi:hypothetical protein
MAALGPPQPSGFGVFTAGPRALSSHRLPDVVGVAIARTYADRALLCGLLVRMVRLVIGGGVVCPD